MFILYIVSVANPLCCSANTPFFSAVVNTPIPSGLVKYRLQPAWADAFFLTFSVAIMPVTAKPNIGSGASIEWPPAKAIPGPGENASVNPEQVQNLFDDAAVEQVAEQANAPKQDVYSAISQVLPQIIDSLTPQAGQTNPQEANADIQQVLNLVSGFLKR